MLFGKKISIFMHRFKSAILAIFQFWQNGTFEPMYGIQTFFGPKDFFWSVMKMTFTKNIPNMSQGPPNPGFRYFILENWDFFKKDSQDFKNYFNLSSCEFLAKLESGYSLMVHCCKNTVWTHYNYIFFHFYQNSTFEPVHENWNFFAKKHSFEALWKWH